MENKNFFLNNEIKLSIVIPMYNAERFIGRLLDRLLEQLNEETELILTDDGSVDKTIDLVKEKICYDKRVTLITQSNKGTSAARNVGISASSGKYITFVDADDMVKEDFVESICSMLYNYPNMDMYITGFEVYDFNGNYYDTVSNEDRLINNNERIIRALFNDEINAEASMQGKVLNRQFVLDNSLFLDESCKKMVDEELFARCFFYIERLYLSSYVGVMWLRNGESLTEKHFKDTSYYAKKSLDNFKKLYDKYDGISPIWLYKKQKALIEYQLEKINNNTLQRKEYKQAIANVIKNNMNLDYIENSYNGEEKLVFRLCIKYNTIVFYEMYMIQCKTMNIAKRVVNAVIRLRKSSSI